MEFNGPTKELIIGVVEKDDAILMRKKPAGSPPYKETWYLFGCEPAVHKTNPEALKDYLKSAIGIDVEVSQDLIPPAFEVKEDHDNVTKLFTYINLRCTYIGGTPQIPAGAEQVAWVPKDNLADYDLVPPTRALLGAMGYIASK